MDDATELLARASRVAQDRKRQRDEEEAEESLKTVAEEIQTAPEYIEALKLYRVVEANREALEDVLEDEDADPDDIIAARRLLKKSIEARNEALNTLYATETWYTFDALCESAEDELVELFESTQ